MLNVVDRPFAIPEQVHLTEDQLERLRVIEDYDLWFIVERVRGKAILSSLRADEAVNEFRKYMALVALGYKELGMHSPEVDEIWHNFILFTREYAEFCGKVYGEMIHHRPNTSRRPELPTTSVSEFKAAYAKYFGPLPAIWRTHKLNAVPDCDVTQAPPPAIQALADCDVNNAGQCDNDTVDRCDSGSDVTTDSAGAAASAFM